ncbi:hypothetical protein HHK36_013542 [Tetracentron sinense]|uniref:Uncharacterized protein n=1 Tax=Tetracentron sinense TaxID=13715 RepID=A0A834Z6H1_TETSI|nr:hypothetical protein HHK36_013542 [Tetracentron sinense]
MSTPSRKRLMRDFKSLQQDPPAGISGAPQDNNINHDDFLPKLSVTKDFSQPHSPLPVTVAPAPLPSSLPQSLPRILISNRSRSRNESNKDSGSFKVSACLTIVVLAAQLFCWTGQFIGHGVFEKRALALLDNLSQALLMVPFFVLLEALQMFYG